MKRQKEYFRQQQEVARRQEEVYRKQQEVLRLQEDVLRQQEMAIFRQLVDGRVLLEQGPLSLQRALYNAQCRTRIVQHLYICYRRKISLRFSSPVSTFSCTMQSGSLRRYALTSSYLMCPEHGALLLWRLATANLWKSASVFLDEPEGIRAYMSRSAEALLELNLLSRIETSADELRCIWSVLIAPHLHRVESLSFIYRCPLQLKETFRYLKFLFPLSSISMLIARARRSILTFTG